MRVTVPSGRFAALFPSRKAKAHAVRVLAIFSVFIGLLAAAAVFSRDWSEFMRGASSRSMGAGQGRASVPGQSSQPGQTDELRLVDPGAGFAQTRVGDMLFPSHNSDMCKRMTFDNRTGTAIETGRVYCGQPVENPADQIGQERAQQMLRAFRK